MPGPGNPDFEQVKASYLERCEEVVSLASEIEKSKFDVQQLQFRLHAFGIQDSCLIPKDLRCGGRQLEDPATTTMKSMITWLADTYDATQTFMFDVGSEVDMGGRPVFLGRMASWHLSGGQKLSVPEELQGEVGALLASARRRIFDQGQLQQFAAVWETVGADVAAEGSTRPAIFLVHREMAQAIVVAAWPTFQAEPVAKFDPDEYFQALLTKDLAKTPMGTGKLDSPKSPQFELPAAPKFRMSTGDQVEVRCEGKWLPGVLASIDGDAAHVHCDSGLPGSLTVALLVNVRPAVRRSVSRQLRGLPRSRSVGSLSFV
jgi:hypothetical protein